MGNYSISYFKAGSKEFAYVDARTYTTAQNALVRATLHLNSTPELGGAAIIYQGKKVQKRVRTVQFWNHDPNHK